MPKMQLKNSLFSVVEVASTYIISLFFNKLFKLTGKRPFFLINLLLNQGSYTEILFVKGLMRGSKDFAKSPNPISPIFLPFNNCAL